MEAVCRRNTTAASPDEEHEGQKVHNPQIGLSFIRRVLSALASIGGSLGLPVPGYVEDILAHLAPFNTARLNPLDPHRWAYYIILYH